MRITHLKIEGFRRFAETQTVRLDGRAIALVGPNEAGKTSLLRALESFDNDAPLLERDNTRDLPNGQARVEATFELEASDSAALASIPGGESIRRVTFVKTASGLQVDLHPRPPSDLQPRRTFVAQLGTMKSNAILRTAARNRSISYSNKLLDDLISAASTDADPIGRSFRRAADAFEKAASQALTNLKNQDDGRESLITTLADLKELRQHESNTPADQCAAVLLERRPRFLFFSDEQRQLAPSYDLRSAASNPPAPLANLASLAQLDLAELLQKIKEGKHARVARLCELATNRLAEVFSNTWVREDVVPKLDIVNESELHIFVRTPGGDDLSPFDDRSDGFRWFVALLSFVRGQRERASLPILLVDEAETHLSYDAQANLSHAFASQDVAQLVVYSTHSAGCLPPDLGTGVRPIVPAESGERSRVVNGFWHIDGPGYTPLIMAMGASALAFTPARRVVVGEGASECVLLPSLLREANAPDGPTFQVAPGLANVTAPAMSDVMSMAGQIAYLVDSDEGGDQLREHLLGLGFPAGKIVSYRNVGRLAITLEDLIHPGTFAHAVRLELERWQGTEQQISPNELPRTSRMTWLNEWCTSNNLQPLNKPVLAQRIVDLAPSMPLVDPARRDLLRRLLQRLEAVLDQP